MKIMFLLTIYEVGGISTVAKNLSEALGSEKFEIVLLTEKLSLRHYPIDSNIKLINLDISPHKGFIAKAFNMMRHLISMRRYIINEAPDIILSFGAYMNCHMLLSLLFLRGKRPKVILTEHSEEMFLKIRNEAPRVKARGFLERNTEWLLPIRGLKTEVLWPRMYKNMRYAFFNKAYRVLMLFLYHKADYIVAVSKSIAFSVKKIFFVMPYKIKVIYNPVDINRIKRLCKEEGPLLNFNRPLPCIGTVSRLSSEKGIHFLIQGFKVLLDKTDARLIIVGDGMERLRLEQMVRGLGMQEKVIFTGSADNPFKYIAKMDVFVLPSLWEGFPNVLLEAMACGVPVVASDSGGGIKEIIINEVNGLLIKPGSYLDIAESVYDLLSNKEKRLKIIGEAYKKVEQFDIGLIKKEYMSLILLPPPPTRWSNHSTA